MGTLSKIRKSIFCRVSVFLREERRGVKWYTRFCQPLLSSVVNSIHLVILGAKLILPEFCSGIFLVYIDVVSGFDLWLMQIFPTCQQILSTAPQCNVLNSWFLNDLLVHSRTLEKPAKTGITRGGEWGYVIDALIHSIISISICELAIS